MANVNNIIGDHAVPAFDKVEHAFGLAHVAIAHIEHAHAINVHKASVNYSMRSKELVENSLAHLEKFKSMERCREYRDMQTVAHRLEFIVRGLSMSHHPHRRTEYRQIFKNFRSSFGTYRF